MNKIIISLVFLLCACDDCESHFDMTVYNQVFNDCVKNGSVQFCSRQAEHISRTEVCKKK